MSGFKEEDHKRDEDGKFSASGATGDAGADHENPARKYLDKHPDNVVAGVQDFYRSELQGKPAKATLGELGEKDVHFTDEGLGKIRQDMNLHPIKAEVAGRIREVIETGEYLKGELPYKERKDKNIIAFHYIKKRVQTSEGPKDVIVDITERRGSRFEYRFYTLNYEGFKTWETKLKKMGNEKPPADSYRVLLPARNTRDARLASHYHASQTASGSVESNIVTGNGNVNEELGNNKQAGTSNSGCQVRVLKRLSQVPAVEPNVATSEARVNIYIIGEDEDVSKMPEEKTISNARITNWRVDSDGLLRVTAHILKEGVYPYGADESDTVDILPGVDPVQEYIPLSEFTEAALTSLEGKPVVINAHEWRDVENTLVDGLTVGTIAGRPTVTDDGCIECDMLIMDPDTIKRITDKELVEVSAGYNAHLQVGDGDFGGRPYHGMQTSLEFNHVLLLPPGMGRCGYDVRIINSPGEAPQNTQGAETMSYHTIKVTIGNKQRSFKFTNEEDAAQAENMLNEEQTFNAEAVSAAMAEITELKAKLEEQTGLLEQAKAQIDEILSPAAQEARAGELVAQKEDEEAIVNAETESGEGEEEEGGKDEEKEAFGNAIKKCSTMAERRTAIVAKVMNKRGVNTGNWNQDTIDGAFRIMAMNARANVKPKTGQEPERVLNGSRAPGQDGAPKNNRDRMLAPMKAANAKPQK